MSAPQISEGAKAALKESIQAARSWIKMAADDLSHAVSSLEILSLALQAAPQVAAEVVSSDSIRMRPDGSTRQGNGASQEVDRCREALMLCQTLLRRCEGGRLEIPSADSDSSAAVGQDGKEGAV